MSYQARAWIDDVDEALLKEIGGCVKVYDKWGNEIDLPEEGLIIRRPENDYRIETYPSVSIYNISAVHSRIRQLDQKMDVVFDHSNAKSYFYKSGVPFDLSYQIDFWSKYKQDMNLMLKTWLLKHYRQFNLVIENDEGYSCNVLQEGRIVKSDLLEDDERLYHSIIYYMIWVEIADETLYNENIVERVDIDIQSSIRR